MQPPPQPAPRPTAPRPTGPRRAGAALAVLALTAAACAYVALVDPHVPGHYAPCPVLALTGLHCPGCGGLRSVHALLHGDPAASLAANALVLPGATALLAAFLTHAVRGTAPRWARPGPALWASALVTAVFTVLRNLPQGAALAP